MYYDNKKIGLTPEDTNILFDELAKAAKIMEPYREKIDPCICFNWFLKRSSLREKIVDNQELIAYIFFQFSDFLKNPKCLI